MALTPPTVEIRVNASWTDISSYVRDDIVIVRGRRGEGQTASPQSATLTINNTDGRFSPRNPTGVYYGGIGRNTPLRIRYATDYRFYGEVSEWPQQWGHAERDGSVILVASGVLRRMSQGSAPAQSAYRRGCTSLVAPVAGLVGYWPLEDSVGSQRLASGLSGGTAGHWSGDLTLANDSTSFDCSDNLLKVTTARCSFAEAYTNTGDIQVRFLLSIPSGGTTNNSVIARIWCTGSVRQWDLIYTTGGYLTLTNYDVTGGSTTSGALSLGLNGTPCRVTVSLSSAASITWAYSAIAPGDSTVIDSTSGTRSGSTGKVTYFELNATRDATDCVFGHLTIQDEITATNDLTDQLEGYYAEAAAARVDRIVSEEGLTSYITGSTAGTPMGYQPQQNPLAILRECETADAGILFEPRDDLGIAYRSARGLFLQDTSVTLDYNGGEISDLSPTEDDQTLCNDMTASRSGGTSLRYTQDSGLMSTQDPPDGIGVYDSSISVNVAGDAQLLDVASWSVHLGTINEPRYPHIEVFLNRINIVEDSTLSAALADLDICDRITVTFTDPPQWLAPEDINQIVIGYTEKISSASRSLELVCVPESAYHIGIYGSSSYATRYQPSDTVTAGTMTTTSTSRTMTVVQLWTTSGGDFPLDIMIGGEQITVSSISGSSSPQTFNFSARSVNGVVKSHAAGESVTLYDPSYYAY